MEWFNLHRSVVEGERMQDASAEAVRAWLFMSVYCAGQENGGRISGAKGWNERKWLKQCGLSLEIVEQNCQLWSWDGEDLVLEYYPVDQELTLKKQRRGGAIGGKRKALNFKGHLKGEVATDLVGEGVGGLEGSLEGDLLRKGREGKEKKGKEREGATRAGQFSSDPEEETIPTEAEVRTWAEFAGVNPEFAAQKWAALNETHGWVKNGRLVEWRLRVKRYWEEDREGWLKKRAAKNGSSYPDGAPEKPAGWKEGDQGWWWSEGVELLEKALTGALLGGDPQAARLREILKARSYPDGAKK